MTDSDREKMVKELAVNLRIPRSEARVLLNNLEDEV